MMQPSLLNQEEDAEALDIQGLTYISDFISVQEQDLLLSQIDQQSWLTDKGDS